ncbi:MAG: hypothetical protein AMJ64_08370, partial [Betaproteobacteria bacterium SG8_39]
MNLSRIVAHWADQTPDRTAIHYQGTDLGYAELWRRIERATAALSALGIARGERVAILAYNCPEILVLLLAAARLGALMVPLNWRLTVAEHRLILADCTPKLLLAEDDWRPHAEQLGLPVRPLSALEGTAHRAGDARLGGSDADDALIVYTSGTTGRPKGAVLTQGGLIWNAYNAIAAHDMGQQDHALNALPMFHVGGLNIQGLPVLVAGARMTLHRRFAPEHWLADVA